jgi:galactose mutarotase-like enzyme
MVLIFNRELSVTISPLGAELQSVVRNDNGLEYLWSGDPAFWGKKSPVLFPVVGGLRNNGYTYNGQRYNLGRHGFAREQAFDIVSQSKEQVSFRLTDNETTRKHYPFHFIFYIDYRLENDRLRVIYRVENSDKKDLLFSVGAHPAFRVPLAPDTSYEDYYLFFEEEENSPIWPISSTGDIALSPQPFLEGTRKLPLKKSLFYRDALVFKDLQSRSISLKSDRTPYGVSIRFDAFPYMGIWAAKDADFLCIEPWCGIGDSEAASGELAGKEGINRLPPGGLFEREWSAQFYAH